jgi:hypothetical protein
MKDGTCVRRLRREVQVILIVLVLAPLAIYSTGQIWALIFIGIIYFVSGIYAAYSVVRLLKGHNQVRDRFSR